MDARHFDALARVLSAGGSRRHVAALLAALPILSGLAALLDPDVADAAGRRKRRKKRHKHGDNRRRKRKNKHKKKPNHPTCTPDSRAQTCAGQCGAVPNNCGVIVECGPCQCDPTCPACFTCEEGTATPGTCVIDPAQQGEACGAGNKVCQPDGSCACIPTTCAEAGVPCGPLADGCGTTLDCGSCSCAPACDVCFTCEEEGPNTPGTCVVDAAQQGAPCGSDGRVCQPDGSCTCVPLSECPAGKECGTYPDGCGGFVTCPSICINPTPICSDNVCGACTADSQCASGEICAEGQCVTGSGTCAAGANVCTAPGSESLCNGENSGCFCIPTRDGATRCAVYYQTGQGFLRPCSSDAECADLGPGAFCPTQFDSCGGVCSLPCPAA